MQNLNELIKQEYGIDIKKYSFYRDNIIMDAENQKFILKNINFSGERAIFICNAKEHLINKGFTQLEKYIVFDKKSPVIVIDDRSYILCEHITGRDCDFDRQNDLLAAAELLARFHSASKGFAIKNLTGYKNDLGQLPLLLQKRLDEMKKLKKAAKKGKDSFDNIYCDYSDYFINMGEKALALLLASNYGELCVKAGREGCFCHNDFTHYNICMNNKGLYLINFEFISIELPIYDLANFIRRKMRKCNWDIKECMKIIDTYSEISKLTKEDFRILLVHLMFPQKFWRTANRYYNSRRGYAEKSHLIKINETIDEITVHANFINELKSCL